MARTVGIGIQSFEEIRENNYFYVDKTSFIKEWWEKGDSVTLITRPRRFGKTMNMSMLEVFFFCGVCRKSRFIAGEKEIEDSFGHVEFKTPVRPVSGDIR